MPDWLASRFSLVGLVAVVIQQIPGIIWAIHPPKVDPFAENSGTLAVEILEKTSGIATILLLVVVTARTSLFQSRATTFARSLRSPEVEQHDRRAVSEWFPVAVVYCAR